jgi:hypothetical protein
MTKKFIFGAVFILNSCALFDKYDSNQLSAYHNSLTKIEKEKINSEGQLSKDWDGKNSLGDYEKGKLIIFKKTDRVYKFVQVGLWESSYILQKEIRQNGILKQVMNFDSLGNLRSCESYHRPKNKVNFYLANRITSEITSDNKLLQKIERINQGGWIMYYIILEYANYENIDNDWSKEKIVLEVKYFDKDGNEVSKYPDKDIGGLVKRVRMKK